MISLLPNEHWDYSFIDASRGLAYALGRRKRVGVELVTIPGAGDCLAVRSGRAAVVVALKALGLRPNARVGVPLYCCPVVFKAITAAGCVPRFLDVDPKTYCVSPTDVRLKRSELDAIIAVHMFGNVCPVPQLRDAAPNIPIVEDCAQSLGSRLNGSLTGTLGDIGFFSFRLGKYLSVGEGAALFSSDARLRSRISDIIAGLPSAGRMEECAHVIKTWLRCVLRTRPLWGLVGVHLWAVYNHKVKYTSKSPLVMGRIYGPDITTIVRRLPLLDGWVHRQRRNAAYYARNLAIEGRMLCDEAPGTFYNRLQYPLLTDAPAQAERLAAFLYKQNISSARPYRDIAAIAAEYYGYRGDCPRAERIASTVIVIPCNHTLRDRHLERVTHAVNAAWAQISKGQEQN